MTNHTGREAITDRETVLAKYPKAYAHHWADQWVIYHGNWPNMHIGSGKTQKAAWENAAAPLQSADKGKP